MKISRSIGDVHDALAAARTTGDRIGLVPTMGGLHEGHVALLRAARRECRLVVATIFVNPAQFGDPADLAAYPRDEARDTAIAREAGVDLLFVPSAAEIYPARFASWVEVEGAALGLEGEARPGHFKGVATVCLKLFLIVRPAVAFFGLKDAQQAAVIAQVVGDLHVPVELRLIATVREADGLALSTRNARLSPDERARATAIPRALEAGRAAYLEGRDPVAAARRLLAGLECDYVAQRDLHGHPTLLVAVRVGRTRLIDNLWLDET